MRIGSVAIILLCVLARPALAVPINALVISEVLYDASGGDNGLEWVELFNGTDSPIDLGSWSLGWGGASFAHATAALAGVLGAGRYYVIGGPASGSRNASPAYDRVQDFAPDLQNAGSVADAIGLFDRFADAIDADSVPWFSVIYGARNSNQLIANDGVAHQPDVADAPGGSSIEYLGGSDWRVQSEPTPGFGPLFADANPTPVSVPEPGLPGLAIAGFLAWQLLALQRSAASARNGAV